MKAPISWRFLVIPLPLILAAAGWAWSRNRPAGIGFPPVAAARGRPAPDDRPETDLVGSAACLDCHPQATAGFRHSGMGRSMVEVDGALAVPDGVFDHPASRRRYRAHRRDGQLWHRESLLIDGQEGPVLADVPIRYAVGSGAYAHTFLAELDGFLVESPLTWYASRDAWDMSPGYDQPGQMGFQRAVGEGCLFCHAGRAEAIEGSLHRIRIHEAAIGCERCHGPGAAHVRRHARAPGGQATPDDTIVNPRHLPRELAEAVCQQCHLQASVAVAAPGTDQKAFRPGLPLAAFRHDYRLQEAEVELMVVGHVEQLHLSRCYQGSTMTCTTCHNPHDEPPAAERDRHYQDICLSCHEPAGCTVDPRTRDLESPANRCVQCHMPRAPTEVPHVAFTHHRIGRHDRPQPPPAAEIGELRAVLELPPLGEAERRRSLGLAFMELVNAAAGLARDVGIEVPSSRSWILRARDLLAPLAEDGPRDPLLAAALVRLQTVDSIEGLVPLADAVLADPGLPPRDRGDLLFNRARALVAEARFAEAAASLEELTALRRQSIDWLMLGDCRRALGDTKGSVAAYEAAVGIDPRLWAIHRRLAAHHRREGDLEKAAWHEDRAVP